MDERVTRITIVSGHDKSATQYQRGDIGKPTFPLDDSWLLCCPGCGAWTYLSSDDIRYENGTVSTREPLSCHGQNYSVEQNEVIWL